MTALTANASAVYAALLRHCDLSDETDAAGFTWRQIYLDNARPAGMSARSFAGYLSALKAAGLYRTQGDDCFGLVRLPAVPAPTPDADQAVAAIEAGLVASGAIDAPAMSARDRAATVLSIETMRAKAETADAVDAMRLRAAAARLEADLAEAPAYMAQQCTHDSSPDRGSYLYRGDHPRTGTLLSPIFHDTMDQFRWMDANGYARQPYDPAHPVGVYAKAPAVA